MDILLEQLVYGSFPFWDRGYDVLARSPGCRPEWASGAVAACRRFGEAPSGVVAAPCLFALRLDGGPWAVVGVEPQGSDDRGRPGALAFHVLLVLDRDYRRAGSDPFAFAGALRGDWVEGTSLDSAFWTVEKPPPTAPADPRALRIADALARGRRVALESTGPIDGLAREVWAALPEARRRRVSVATWAFGNGNRFDLVGLPRLAGVALDGSYVDPDLAPPASRWPAIPRRAWMVAPLVGIVAAGVVWRSGESRPVGTPDEPPPVRVEADLPLTPGDRAKVLDGLDRLAGRFEVGGGGDPAEIMARLGDRLHYRGPTLTEGDRARLAGESDPDRDRALAWDGRIRDFLDDRPMPADFDRLPLPRQLDALARSFHLEPPPDPAEVPEFLADALSRDGPIRPTPLASKYPPLSDYARFLGRLPRRGE